MNYQTLAIILVLFTAVALYTDNTGNFFIFLILAFILISLFFGIEEEKFGNNLSQQLN